MSIGDAVRGVGGAIRRLIGRSALASTLLGAALPVLLSTALHTGPGFHLHELSPLVAGLFAGWLVQRNVVRTVLVGGLAGALGFVPVWALAPGRVAFGVFGPKGKPSPLVLGVLGVVFAGLLGGIGAYTATVFETQEGRDAWYRHWKRWRWW